MSKIIILHIKISIVKKEINLHIKISTIKL